MTNDDRIADLLLRWEDGFEQGQDVPTEQLCRDCPELVGEVSERIESLKRTTWLLKLAENPPVSPALPPTVQPGHVVGGRYRLDRQVGVGGFGEVWDGFDMELHRRVAVKAPRQAHLSSQGQVEQFLEEARRLARLKRPGIVAVYDVVRDDGRCYIITEFIDGMSLAERMRQGRPDPEEAVKIVAEIAGLLAFAHEQNFIHQDVKPGNILLDAQGHAHLTDFGIAGTVEEVNGDGRASVGTLAYASPEQIAGHPVDARTDIYSLGVVVFELLTGQRPFEASNPSDLRAKILQEPPPAPRSLNPAVSKPLEAICLRCLAKTPADRYQSAQALVDDLSRYTTRCRGGTGMAWAGAILLLGGIAVGTAFWTAHDGKDAERPAGTETPEKDAEAWFKFVASLKPDEQIQEVGKKLAALNPDFDGKVKGKVEGRKVVELTFITDQVADISPVRALAGLQRLNCTGSNLGKGKLTDLSPLKGMSLTELNCNNSPISSLEPLKGMPLTRLGCIGGKFSDLSPLSGMPLEAFDCHHSPVSDLSPLKGLPLTYLVCSATRVKDLSPLRGLPLSDLHCNGTLVSDLTPLKELPLRLLSISETQVKDLSPLSGMALKTLNCTAPLVTDLSPLKGLPLTNLRCDFRPERDSEILRSIKTLEKINGKDAKQFWKDEEKK